MQGIRDKINIPNAACYAFRLFGDEHELNFWTIALHYLRGEKADPNSKVLGDNNGKQSNNFSLIHQVH